MATHEEASQALLDAIQGFVSKASNSESFSRTVLNLAEAWAWLQVPGAGHGGGGSIRSA